jgi:prevent-host-death family protein
MFHMKTASVRLLRQDFGQVLAWVEAGEEVAITRRRQPVARLVSFQPRKKSKHRLPDIAARLSKVFGQKVIPDRTMKAILDRNRAPV